MHITDWQDDPFAHGSYAYMTVGSTTADHDDLATPVGGVLHIAGEATWTDDPATVTAACTPATARRRTSCSGRSRSTRCGRTVRAESARRLKAEGKRSGPSPRDSGLVEMGGIEPPSIAGILRLLRAQSVRRSARLRPLSQTPKSTSPAWEESRVTSRRRHAASPLDDARVRSGNTYGLTDFRLAYAARAKSLRFASAIMFLQRSFTR